MSHCLKSICRLVWLSSKIRKLQLWEEDTSSDLKVTLYYIPHSSFMRQGFSHMAPKLEPCRGACSSA